MDINLPISAQNLLGANRVAENALNLKVGQQLDVKVIGAEITAAKNAITLNLGNQDISVQSTQPMSLNSGQNIKIQVIQIAPVVVFKILDLLPELKGQSAELRLKLMPTVRDAGSVAIGTAVRMQELTQLPRETMLTEQDGALLLSLKQQVDAKIISIVGTKVQLQIDTEKPLLVTIERTQLTPVAQPLKAGQSLNLEFVNTGATPEFKIVPFADNIPEAKIAEFIKLFLPRHQAAPILINQLIKELPRLLNDASVPKTLKDIAVNIVQNLPPKEQLISSSGLKQAIADSGLFLEAKLSAEAELIKVLPQLIKNDSVPQTLQGIAAEIVRNLIQTKPLLGQATVSKPVSVAELLAFNLDPAGDGESGALQAGALGAEDFKGNLLKFIQALKQEHDSQSAQQITQTDLDLLKNLQTKTESTVAKLVLDQLMSLPKEDNPKQLWIIDMPFIDRQQADTVKIEIQQDKEHNRSTGSGSDWSVNITITPPELGTIQCRISYQNELINTFFKSRNIQTTELIKDNLDYLKNQLEASGLTTGHMDAHDDAEKNQPTHQLAGKKLFDDNA